MTRLRREVAAVTAAAIAELEAEGKCPNETRHRQVKYLGKLELLIRPVRGFKTLKTTYTTIKGFEVMRALRKGQAGIFALHDGIVGEARIVERAFALGPCALTEVIALLQDRLTNAEACGGHISLPDDLVRSSGLQQSRRSSLIRSNQLFLLVGPPGLEPGTDGL